MKRLVFLGAILAFIGGHAWGQSYQFGSTSSVAVTSVSDGTDNLAINSDGSLNVVGTATDLDIRDLVSASDEVGIGDGTDSLGVNADGSINAVCSATNLDVRDLTDASDSVQIGDGTDTLLVAADGSITVNNQTALDQASDSVAIGDGTDTIAISASGEASVTLTTAIPAGTNNIGVVESAGKSSVEVVRNDHSSTAVTTGAYVELVASTSGTINRFHIFDSSGEALILATGAAASEVDVAYIPPGGLDAPLDLNVASGTRLSVKALTADTSVGDLIITALD